MKIGDKIKLDDDGVIRTYTVTKPGMRHPSERLKENEVYLTSPGVMGFDASIDWVNQNMIHDKMATGGGVGGKRKFYTYVWKTKSAVLNDDYEVNKDEDMSQDEIIKYYEERIRRGYDFAVQIYDKKTNKQIYRSKTYDLTWDEYDDENQYAKGGAVGKKEEKYWVFVVSYAMRDKGEDRMLAKTYRLTITVSATTEKAAEREAKKAIREQHKYGNKVFNYIEPKLIEEMTLQEYIESQRPKNYENGGNMKNTHMMEDGGVIGQEIVFDDNGEENTGVIKDIHEITGNYIVATDDGRTVLADKELDVISLGKIREPKSSKRFSFFEDGGNIKVGDYVKVKYPNETKAIKRKVTYIDKDNNGNVISYFFKDGSNASPKLLIHKMEDGGNIGKENNEMLHSQAKEAKHHIEELHNILTSKTKVEPWVVAKMTRAKTDLSDITHYLEGASHKMAKGGKLTDAQQEKFNKVMHEWKQGKLHSGSAKGPIVKDQDQAIAIAYSEAYGMDKMLFGGMVNDLSDDTIDRMEGLVPISTLQELLDNAKFIIADMYEEGFEKDEIMSFLAYKISQIGGGKMAKGGGVGKKGRYHVLGELAGKQPVLYSSTNNKNDISKLVNQADKDLFDLTGKKHKIFVTDSNTDEQIYHYEHGGEVGKKGRYHILGELAGKQPVLYSSTNDKNSISKLVEQADKDLYDLTGKKHKIFVTDSINDEELYNYAQGGGVGSKKQNYVEVTNGDTILSLEKTNGVWGEVDVLQGVKPVNFGRNTYKGNLDAEALVDALNKEYGGGYSISYVFMNGGKMATGGGVDSKREYLENRLWNERGYDYPFLNKLSFKELRSLYDTEFYYDEIYAKGGGVDDVMVIDKKNNQHLINLDKGERYNRGGGIKDDKVIFNLDTYEIRYKGTKDKAKSWVEHKGTMMNRLGYSIDGKNFKTVKAMKEYYKNRVDNKMSTGGKMSGWKHKSK